MTSEATGPAWGFVRRHGLTFRVAVGVLVLVTSVALLLRGQKPAPTKASPIGARLELASGEVTVKSGDASASVVSGIPLPAGAELATGKGARALARLADGSSVFLRGDSKVVLGETGLELAAGEVWLDAPPSERGGLTHKLGDVAVSAAEAGLSMKRDGSAVTIYVTRGLAIVVAPGGRVEVNAGEQAIVAAGAPPKVAPLAYWEDWTGGMGDHRALGGDGAGSGRIYGVDRDGPAGAPARTLEISRQSVRAVLRDGLAETEVDQTFSNPGGRQVEGWYWFTIPERAVVTSFAVETDGVLVEGEVIERQEAAARYQAAVRAAHEPALLEWIDGRSYRARIYPVPASGSRRVVLRYMELLPSRDGKIAYLYPMRAADPVQIGELSLVVDLGDAGRGAPISTLADAVIEDAGRRVSMRRSGYEPRADFQLEATLARTGGAKEAFRVARFAAGQDRADYLMARYVPDVDWSAIKELPGDLVVVVDTSASADEAARQQKAAAAEAILRAMSPSDHFALIALDAAPAVLYPKDGLAEASEKEIAVALERLAEHSTGGATDLGALFDVALGRVHGKEQPAVIYIGDGLPTSGEVSGERLAERMRRSLSASRARFFTVGVGPDANHGLLRELARLGGGQHFRIDEVEGSTAEVLRLASAIKTPTITDLAVDLGAGLDEPMMTVSGKVSRGEEVILLARTHHPLPATATVKGRLGGKDFSREYPVALDNGVGAALVPRLWAMEKVRRLLGESADPEQHREIVELGLDYGLTTPFTSVLALENEQAYQRQGIRRRRSPLRGVRLTELTPAAERDLVDARAPPIEPVAFGCAKMDRSEGSAAPPAQTEQAQPAESKVNVAAEPAPAATAAPMAADEAPPPDHAARAAASKPKMAMPSGGGGTKLEADGDLERTLGTDPYDDKELAKSTPAAARIAGKKDLGFAPASPPPPPARPAGPAKMAKQAGPREEDKSTREAPRPQVQKLAFCSDTARRPLADRIVVWASRLKNAAGADDLVARYEGARATCELYDWRAEQAMLDLVQARVKTEGGAAALLAHFAGERDKQRFVARAILRRSVDARITAAVRRVLFDDGARWTALEEELAAVAAVEERLAKMRAAVAASPGDPEGEIRLVRLLAEAGQKEEAVALGRRLRDKGFMTPALALDLGDVLAQSGFGDDAIRTYSEIVEFDPSSADSRRLLGDVYLRNRWYPAAYRQYKTLTEAANDDALGWLRLAAAAAGSGRVDEALRLERQVASAEGTPGPNDPRPWARLLSASRIARLLAPQEGDPKPDAAQTEGLSRKLKELGLVSGPAAVVILAWEDYGAALSLAAMDGDRDAPAGEVSDALPVGLTSAILGAAEAERLRWVVRWHSDPPKRDVAFALHTLVWDGKAFKVSVKKGVIGPKQREVAP